MEGAAELQHERASLERAHERAPLGVQLTRLREQVVAREVRARAGSASGAGARAAHRRGRCGRGGGGGGRRRPRETFRDGRDAVDIFEHTLNSEGSETS